jgi:hypothetical protein
MKNVEMDKRFVWLEWVYTLLKELNTTDTVIYEKNYISCLNWMSFFYQKNKVNESKKGNI